ncbi:MAG: hypothetical protein RMY34_13560 [Aulosira sp. DedQUE10]|nr:hypothetical protein [Aulosira sp. DedQUE10]
MNSEQSQPRIDFSHAKEPAVSPNLEQEKAKLKSQEVSGQIDQKPLPDDLNHQEQSAENFGERQIIVANIPGGAATNLNDAHD